MTMRNYTDAVSTKSTPQMEPIPGTSQVANHEGGFVFAVDDWTRLDRFLIMGTTGGSFYVGERDLTKQGGEVILRLLKLDGLRVVKRIVEVSTDGRAPKNEPAIFALAMALKVGDGDVRQAAENAVSKVCRIGTHLFQLAEAVNAFGGWGRRTKRTFARWYLDRNLDALGHQLVKYQQRDGWSHRDLLRLAHPHPGTDRARSNLLRYAVGKPVEGTLPDIVKGFELAKTAESSAQIVKLIGDFKLPRECIPTQFLNDVSVWEALLGNAENAMPLTAMIRNLAKMTSIELLKPLSKAVGLVTERLRNEEALHEARVHPLNLLVALRTYQQGKGEKGSLEWTPVPQIAEALEDAFYLSFKTTKPTGKNFLLGVDVSGSMDSNANGTILSCREIAAAMAMVTARTEQNYFIHGFTGRFIDLGITAKDSLNDAMKKANRGFERTDCSLPMEYAIKHKLDVDAFCVYTDNETYAGDRHPVQALRDYREKSGRAAKLVVFGMAVNDFSIADPDDGGMLDVVGFDASVPTLLTNFILA